MYFPDFLQFFLYYLTNAEHVIRRDRLCPVYTENSQLILYVCSSAAQNIDGNIIYAHDNRDTLRHVYNILSYMWLIGRQLRNDIHFIQITRV
jgi:hypothetical protein